MGYKRDVSEIRNLGTCRVNHDGRDMGHTQGGCSVKITTQIREVVVDEYGVVPVDNVDQGTIIEVVTPLAQASWDNYVDAYPMGQTILAANQLSFGRKVGDSLATARLVLDPLRVADDDGVVIYKAYVKDVAELGYNNEGERIVAITWGGEIDTSRAAGDMCFRIFGGMS